MGVKKASALKRKPLKILLFGDSGTGKTHFALQSTPGKILIFDAESGTDLFEGREGFDFDYWVDDDGLKTPSIRELNKAIDYLDTPEGREKYDTFVIDPISDIWDNIQAQRLEYKDQKALEKARKQNKEFSLEDRNEAELESFNTKDWGDMKRIYKNLMLRLKNLPQNIILIAREKDILEVKPDGSIIRTGEYTYEAEKNTKYAVDFTIRLVFDEKNKKRYAVVQKSRSDEFEKLQIFNDPTFAIFDKLVNKMKDADNVFGTSTKEENVFLDEEAKKTNTELPNKIKMIEKLIESLKENGVDKNKIIEVIKQNFELKGKPSANFNAIKNPSVADKVYEELKNLEVK